MSGSRVGDLSERVRNVCEDAGRKERKRKKKRQGANAGSEIVESHDQVCFRLHQTLRVGAFTPKQLTASCLRTRGRRVWRFLGGGADVIVTLRAGGGADELNWCLWGSPVHVTSWLKGSRPLLLAALEVSGGGSDFCWSRRCSLGGGAGASGIRTAVGGKASGSHSWRCSADKHTSKAAAFPTNGFGGTGGNKRHRDSKRRPPPPTAAPGFWKAPLPQLESPSNGADCLTGPP